MSADLALLATTLGLSVFFVPLPQTIVQGAMGGGSAVALLLGSLCRGSRP